MSPKSITRRPNSRRHNKFCHVKSGFQADLSSLLCRLTN